MKCIVCNLNIENDDTLYSVFSLNLSKFCENCRMSFIIDKQETIFKDFSVISLYKYNDFAKKVLNQYKTKGDITLAKIFAIIIKKYLRKKYRKYLVVLAPSSKSRISKLMFNHLEEIMKNTKMNYIKIISKTEDDKQSKKSGNLRAKERDFKLNKSIDQLSNRNLLVFDDILTSGSTMISIHNLLTNLEVKKIEYFTMFKSQNKK